MLKVERYPFNTFDKVPDYNPDIMLYGFNSKAMPVLYKPINGEWVGIEKTLIPGTPIKAIFAYLKVPKDLIDETDIDTTLPSNDTYTNTGINERSIPKYRKQW
jgi:hypothetical protein